MSVKFDRWFGVQPALFELGFFPKMSPSDRALYLTLCCWSDRKSSRQFEVKDAEMEAWSGLSRRSLHDARKHLSSLGMFEITKNLGGHVYTLCNLKTRLPYPGNPKAELRWLKKGANDNARKVEPRATPPVREGGAVRTGKAKTQGFDASEHERGAVGRFDIPPKRSSPTDDTTPKYDFDFNYGWNAKADEPETPIWDDSSF